MKATMKICKELEQWEREATKELEEEADKYHEHPEHEHLQIDKVVHEGEETISSKGDEKNILAPSIL